MEDFTTAKRLGSTLGVMAVYGAPAIREATAAIGRGDATPRQQRIAYELLLAVTKH